MLSRGAVVILILAVSSGCLTGESPRLEAAAPGSQSMSIDEGQTVTFGGGPITATGGTISLQSARLFEASGVGFGSLRFINPEENRGQEPGIWADDAGSFDVMHEPAGLAIEPGERWFFVVTVRGNMPGRHSMGYVQLRYERGGASQTLEVPTNMEVEVEGSAGGSGVASP